MGQNPNWTLPGKFYDNETEFIYSLPHSATPSAPDVLYEGQLSTNTHGAYTKGQMVRYCFLQLTNTYMTKTGIVAVY